MRTAYRWVVVATAAVLVSAGSSRAQWPQWGGPNRDFKVEASGLTSEWPKKQGPPKLWSRDLGDGYSAISVDDGRLFTMYRADSDEVVVALSAETGETIWEHKYAAPFPPGMATNYGPGPHATPLVKGEFVYTVGVGALMKCLEKGSGKLVWGHDLREEFGAKMPQWGYASSPIGYKDMVIVPVGGDGYGVVAFNAADGTVVWHKHDFRVSYASPALLNVDGQDQLVVFVTGKVAGLNPESGELIWEHPHKTEYDINASTPVWGEDNLLFLSSAYDTGSRVLKLTRQGEKTSVEEVWSSRKMQLHFGNAIRMGDYIYGSSGASSGPAFFMAINVHTGKTKWKKRKLGAKASFILAGDKMIILDEDGKLLLATLSPDKVTLHAKYNLLESKAWTVPTLAGTTLYVRDRKKIMAVDLSAAPKAAEAS